MKAIFQAVGLLLAVTAVGHAQSNAPISPPMPRLDYANVAPGVTLHQMSPVLYFRGILGMKDDAQREKALTNKPAAAKARLLQKVKEYEALPKEVREARLRLTELQWELTTLAKLAPTKQAVFIKEAALEDRPLLEKWQRFQTLTADEQTAMLDKLLPLGHQALTQALDLWQTVPAPDRQQASSQFRKIVYLTPDERKEALSGFSETERKTMEAALNRFAALPEAQRKSCIDSFEKFASMDAAERDEFLRNAARWESMSAKDRELWLTLVQSIKLTPPTPPGFFNSVHYPPLPPGLVLSRTVTPPLPPGMAQPMR